MRSSDIQVGDLLYIEKVRLYPHPTPPLTPPIPVTPPPAPPHRTSGSLQMLFCCAQRRRMVGLQWEARDDVFLLCC